MNSTQRNELVAYLHKEFVALAREEAPAPLTPAQRKEFVRWLQLEFRRLSKAGGDMHGCCTVDRTRRVVRVRPVPAPHLCHTMSLPACLRTATTEANLARLGLPRAAWVRMPRNEARI